MILVSEAGDDTAWPLTEMMTSPPRSPAVSAAVPQNTPSTSAPDFTGAIFFGMVICPVLSRQLWLPLPLSLRARGCRRVLAAGHDDAEESAQADLNGGVAAPSGRDQPGDRDSPIDRDREALVLLVAETPGLCGGVHADHLAGRVHQRAA